MTRTPVLIGVLTRFLRIGAGGSRSVEMGVLPAGSGPAPSIG